MKKLTSVSMAVVALASSVACAEDYAAPAAYSRLWNAELQAEIDARIEKHRKADGAF